MANKTIKVKVKTTFRPACEREFGHLPAEWHCEAPFYAQIGRAATEEQAVVNFIWRVESETGRSIVIDWTPTK
jgi:hypothetical protein